LFIKHIFNSLLYHAGRLCFGVRFQVNLFSYFIYFAIIYDFFWVYLLHPCQIWFFMHFQNTSLFLSLSLSHCFFTLHFSHLQHYFL
jgi:hypothetical protein